MEDSTKKCRYCAEEIRVEAIKCKHCGEFLNDYQYHQNSDNGINENNIENAIVNAKITERNTKILTFEILIISIALGIHYRSWWIFGGIFLGSFILLGIRFFAVLYCILISLGWGFVGFMIGAMIHTLSGASIVLGIIFFIVSLGIHRNALDLRRK